MIQIDMKMPSSCYDCPFVKNEKTNDYGSLGECGILEDYETINLLEHSKHHNCHLIEQDHILDNIRAEIDAHREKLKIMADDDWYAGKIRGYDCAIEIIDKYRAEGSEE